MKEKEREVGVSLSKKLCVCHHCMHIKLKSNWYQTKLLKNVGSAIKKFKKSSNTCTQTQKYYKHKID